MLKEVLLPKLGQTVEEATVEQWIKKEGDNVKKGDVLLEITTDKATLEVESFVEGKLLKIYAQPGEVYEVNAVLAYVGDDGDEAPAEAPAPAKAKAETGGAGDDASAAETEAAPAAAAGGAAPAGRIISSPRARALAKVEAVPLQVLRGSGPNGRIVEKDVQAFIEKANAVKATPTARELAAQKGVDITAVKGTGPDGKVTKEDVEAATPSVGAAPVVAGAVVELSAMRRVVADRMSQSKREAPHFYLDLNVDMTNVVAYRAALNAGGGIKISFNDILMKACATVMTEMPVVNSAWDNGRIVRKGNINISVAVALDEGLMVPVVHDVDRKDLPQIAAESKAMIDKARSKKLLPDECIDGSLTISNLGMFGINSFYPVINPGEGSIMGVGAIVPTPVVIDGGIHVRKMMNVSLSCDHRVIDGAVGAQFLAAVKEHLEALEPAV